MTEAYYYNAAALALEGDYIKIERARSGYASWEEVWNAQKSLHTVNPRTKNFGVGVNPDTAWAALKKHGITIMLREAEEFPVLLKEIYRSPFALYIKGVLPQTPVLAIVGTRKATASGKTTAGRFAEQLASTGWSIASGLALGIDGAAHAGALAASGKTVAVLACGLDEVYPSEHSGLAKRIIAGGGALISEYPIGTPALPYRFLERNRIVSGLSRGAVIIEAPEKSGSLATAKFALEQNRDVFVVPGPIGHPNFTGSHALIKAGAALVTSPDDIRAAYGEDVSSKDNNAATIDGLSSEERGVYEAIVAAGGRADIDKLAETANLPSYVVSRAVTFMQLKGIIKECDGTYEIGG